MSIRTQALPELVELWDKTVSDAGAAGIVVAIADFGGFRTDADTAQILQFKQDDYDAYAAAAVAAGHMPLEITQGWDDGNPRPIRPYGQSFHDFGAARDFIVKRWPAGMTQAQAVRRVQDIAIANGLKSGRSYGDDPHLQLPITLEDAAARWDAYDAQRGSVSMTVVWAILAVGVGAITVARYAGGLRNWH